MKQILALILIALLLCGMLAPSILAAAEPSAAAETETMGNKETDDTDKNTVTPREIGHSSVPDGFDYTGSIISFTTLDVFNTTVQMVYGDTEFTQLHNALDSVSIYGTVEKDGASYSVALPVTWDFSTVDAETLGSYTAIGRISVPAGAMLLDESENIVSILVQVTSPDLAVSPSSITLTSFDEPDRTDAVAFAVDTTQAELFDWFADVVAGFIGYDADGNPYDLISGAWSLDAVNTGTVGVYYASASPDLGTEYTLADGISLPKQLCAVSIQRPGEPDINCCVSGRGFLRFPWVISAEQQEQLDEFAVWLRQDGEEWTKLSDGFWFTSEDFQLSQRILEYGSTYELKVTYPGGETGILIFQYDGELSIIDYSDGDRDGGDVNGDESGTGTQPSPTPPQTPSDHNEDDDTNINDDTPIQDNSSSGVTQPIPAALPPSDSRNNEGQNSDNNSPVQAPVADKPAVETFIAPTELAVTVYSDTSLSNEQDNNVVPPSEDSTKAVQYLVPNNNHTQPEITLESQAPTAVTESYSPTQTVISGLRLRDLCKDEENVVFGSGDLTVSIPSKLLLALNLSDSDTLSVRLTQLENNQILLTVEVSEKSVTELKGAVLRFRYMPQSESAEIVVRNEAGEQITDASYDGEFLNFMADVGGVYTIVEIPKEVEDKKSVTSLIFVTGGFVLATGGIILSRKIHRG